MKMLSETLMKRDREEVIAMFGQGRLVQLSRVRLELRGGSKDDQIEAASWLAMFMPEAVLANANTHASMPCEQLLRKFSPGG